MKNAPAERDPAPVPRASLPPGVRYAGAVATVEGAVLLAFALYLVIHAATGYREQDVVISGYGTAGWFVIMGAAVLGAGVGLLRGKRWGRGVAVIAQLVLLPVAYYLGVGSGQWIAGALVAIAAVSCLVGLFRRDSLEWYAA